MDDRSLERWVWMVERIAAGDPAGQEALFDEFGRGMRIYLAHRLGENDVEDKFHDTFLAVIAGIRSGGLRDPARLPGFIRTILKRQAADYIADAIARRSLVAAYSADLPVRAPGPDPEQQAIENERVAAAVRILEKMPELDREILRRFYLENREPEEICRDLKITATQFRVRKSRAKLRFEELAGRWNARSRRSSGLFVRDSAAARH